jgi:hypothetical protein
VGREVVGILQSYYDERHGDTQTAKGETVP